MSDLSEMGEALFRKLDRAGIIPEIGEYTPECNEGEITYGQGYPITGIEKFLGYADSIINIANFPSISINTDFMKTHAFCQFLRESGKDSIVLDGQANERYTKRSEKALNYFKSLYDISGSFRFFVQREKKYSEAKGMGESASIAAAVSRALVTNVFGADATNDDAFTSRFSRLVSGSGTRSVAGGISMWISYPSIREKLSFGFRLDDFSGKMAIAAFPSVSRVRTEDAHGAAIRSIFYDKWAQGKFSSCENIANGNPSAARVMETAERDFYRINSVLLSAGSIIQNPSSIGLIEKVLEFKKKNEGLYFTTDTGPTVIVMSEEANLIREFSDHANVTPLNGKVVSSWDREPPRQLYEAAESYFISS